jgi:phage terminase large subunit
MNITDDEIIELEKLLSLYDLESSLLSPDEESNPNYVFLQKSIQDQQYDEEGQLLSGYRGVALEGSSRSGKTWSGVDIIIWLCLHVEESCTINIYRQTYNEFKTTLYDDFKRRLDDFDLPNPFHKAQEVSSFKIGKNKIYFLGDGKHGGGCDYAFFNEVMHISHAVFKQVEMRCRKFWWADYNPSFTDHWFFDKVLHRPDVGFLRTTFHKNKHISPQERNTILSYEPWEPGSYQVDPDGELIYKGKPIDDKNQPPPHPTNIQNQTDSEFDWKVYGLGLRGAMKGVIFDRVHWIDEFPDIAHTYANDFGFTADPNAFGKYAEDEHNIWVELLAYQPIETDSELAEFYEAVGVEKDALIACDSSDKYTGENKGTIEMVKGLINRGYKNAFKIKKTKSVMFWILSMKQKKIHVVKNHLWKHVKKEKENYRFKEVNGIMINQPVDKYNHFWDMARYGHISHNSDQSTTYKTDPKKLKLMNY